jgi:RNA polymerase sigma factor (sigma-70 family)
MLRPEATPPEAQTRPDAVSVVQRAYPELLRAARRLSTSLADAEDLVQEAFVETLSHYPEFEGIRQPVGYLMTVLYRAAFRRTKRARREIPLELQERLESPPVDGDAPTMVTQVLASLGEKQRACLLLRYLYDLDDDEIANALGCHASTVRSQIARAMARVRERTPDAGD